MLVDFRSSQFVIYLLQRVLVMGKKKQKIVLPPDLPPEVPDEAVEVSDEDVLFVSENREYTGFLSNLDTKSINK